MAQLDSAREIYPNAMLKLVAAELTFFAPLPVDLISIQPDLYQRLKDDFPLPGPAPQQVTFEIAGEGEPRARRAPAGFRFMNRTRSASVVVTPQSMVVETSAYERFERFAELITETASAVSEIAPIPAVSRVGLRYIDEIPETVLPDPDWTAFIEPALLAVMSHFSGPLPTQFNGQAAFDLGEGYELMVRYGLLKDPVVDPRGPLLIKDPPEGRYFLIDIDSYWQSPPNEIPPFSRDAIATTLEMLHRPIRAVFEQSITEKLRNGVLRKEPTK